MVFLMVLLLVAGYTLMYTAMKPPNGNPYDLWFYVREAFGGGR